MPGDSGVTCMLVCASHTTLAHETAGASGARHSLRPDFEQGGKFLAKLGHGVPRECEGMFGIEMLTQPTLVMPGLDPGIHPSSQQRFSKKMDHRVKPGDDESWFVIARSTCDEAIQLSWRGKQDGLLRSRSQ
jgi:hypothetical protein